jgi:WD40 repeat protein/uncharacterized caspase-like protein
MKINQRIFCLTLLLLLLAIVPHATRAQQKPELIVQNAHASTVKSVAYSPDGRLLASGSADQTVKLWDAITNVQLRTILTGQSEGVISIAFSPDSKSIASGGYGGTCKLWDVATGAELRALPGLQGAVTSLAFSPDGTTLAVAQAKPLKLFDVASGKQLREFVQTSPDEIVMTDAVAYSPDGKTLASASGTKIHIWDAATGSKLRTLEGHDSSVTAVMFSHDGKTLASGSDDNTLKLWDAATWREQRTLKEESWIRAVAFSPDDRRVAGGTYENRIKVWNVATGTEAATLYSKYKTVTSVAYNRDGSRIAGGVGIEVLLWNTASGEDLNVSQVSSADSMKLAFDRRTHTLASVSFQKDTVKFWDIASGGALRTLPTKTRQPHSVVFSPDGKLMASGDYQRAAVNNEETHGLTLTAIDTGKELRKFTGYADDVYSVAFSPDAQLLATADLAGTFILWNVTTGKQVRTLKDASLSYSKFSFSPDRRTSLLAMSNSAGVVLLDAKTGAMLHQLPLDKSAGAVQFSPDAQLLATSHEGVITLWNVADGSKLRTLEGHTNRVSNIVFSPDGRSLASVGFDQTARLWDVATGRELHVLSAHHGYVQGVAFSPDGKTLASGGDDRQIKLWDVKTGEDLATLLAVGDDDWLIVTPDGLFDGTPPAWKQILWQFNHNTFDNAPLETFFTDFYYPGLLAEIVEGKRPRAASDISQKDRRQPKLNLARADNAAPSALKPTVNLKINLSEAAPDAAHTGGSGAQDVRLFRNGSLVKVWHGDALKGASAGTLETTIPIVAGDNQFTAYAFNRDNVKSMDATLNIKGAENLRRKGAAYVLAVGVNSYANKDFDLKYAVADAESFSAEWQTQQARLAAYTRTPPVVLTDAQATKENILKALADLKAKVKPEDALVIYFAGHGTAQLNRFYLIPHDLGYEGGRDAIDEAGLKTILAHSISDTELEDAVETIDVGQMLMVIDACNSGQALESEEKRRGPMNSKGLAQLAYEKGMYILTAAQSYQAAQEASKFGHGFLTFALVEEGIKQTKADDEPKDGRVIVREWFDYATKRVPQMQVELMKETNGRGVKVAFIKGEEQIADPNERNVQRPRVFYRRELEAQPLVVAKP